MTHVLQLLLELSLAFSGCLKLGLLSGKSGFLLLGFPLSSLFPFLLLFLLDLALLDLIFKRLETGLSSFAFFGKLGFLPSLLIPGQVSNPSNGVHTNHQTYSIAFVSASCDSC